MTRSLWTMICVGFLLAGCPSPPSTDGGNKGGGGGGGEGGEGGGGEGGGGGATAPEDGQLPPGTGHQPPSEFDAPPEKSVKLSGTVSYAGTRTGELYVDFVKKEEGGNPPMRIVHSIKLDALGAWEVLAPKGTGVVDVVGFIDMNANGPSRGEPIGAVMDLEIGEVDIADLAIEITDEEEGPDDESPDGAPAPPPAGAPAPGSPPPAEGGTGPAPAEGTPAPAGGEAAPAPAPADGGEAAPAPPNEAAPAAGG